MYYMVYETTNNITNRIYVGVHRTKDLNDGYKGSGMLLRKSFKKHGKENFTKKILKLCDTPEDMFDEEARIVDKNFVRRKDTYNLEVGEKNRLLDATDTEYHASGQHTSNARAAQKLSVIKNKQLKEERHKRYYENPTKCVQCNIGLPFNKNQYKFCGSSCAAKHNNTGRIVTEEQKKKTSESNMTEKGRAKRERCKKFREEDDAKRSLRIDIINNLNLDTAKRGWVTVVSNHTGLGRSRIRAWTAKYMPEFHDKDYG